MELQLIMKKIQFNYDLWVNNQDKYDLVTRDGKIPKIYTYDPDNHDKHVLLGSKHGVMTSWDINGYYNAGIESIHDLFMVEKKQKRYYKQIVVCYVLPGTSVVSMEVEDISSLDFVKDTLDKSGLEYQIKEIEFEF